jgi:TolB protein
MSIYVSIMVSLLAGAVSAEPVGRIVFHSDRSGSTEIYSINTDGTDEKRLTSNDAYDGFPSWSMDGGSIYFQSNRNGDDAIYVMTVDGSNVSKVPNTERGRYPKNSADGERLAFFSERDGQTDIFVIDIDGTNLRNITQSASIDETPSWTHDGARIAFQSDRSWRHDDPAAASIAEHSNFGVFRMNDDGSDVVEVTGVATNDENPSISPDGENVVYQSYIDDGLAIMSVNVSTGAKAELTSAKKFSGSPAWSSSGQSIVFDSNDDGNFDIYVMDADGNNRRQITFTEIGENSGAAMFDGRPER